MKYSVLSLLAAFSLGSISLAAEPAPKDTLAAAFTRTKKLKGKVTIDMKNEFLEAVLKELSGQLEDNKLGALSVHYGVGVSKNTRVTYSGKEVSAEEALDGILKQIDLGYHVVAKDKDRYDGWIELAKGTHRGYPPGVTPPAGTTVAVSKDPPKTEPKPEPKPKPPEPTTEPKVEPKPPVPAGDPATPEDEKNAMDRLATAKKLLEEKKDDDAKVLLKYILRKLGNTKAAAEAKELMDKMK